MTTDAFKIKTKARLLTGAAINHLKLAATASTHKEYYSHCENAVEAMQAAMAVAHDVQAKTAPQAKP